MKKHSFLFASFVLPAFFVWACNSDDSPPLGDGSSPPPDSSDPSSDSSEPSSDSSEPFADGSLPIPDGPSTGVDGISTQEIMVKGEARSVSFFAPTSRGSHPPLVIALHGTGGNPDEWITGEDPSGIEYLADENGFVVAAPQSRYIDEADWDHEYGGDIYWETAAPNGSDPNANADLMFVKQIITTAQASFNINPKRVYVVGFSNGGFFSILTAMVLRDQVAAFAAVGSGLVTCDTTRSCEAQSSTTDCAEIRSSAGCSCSGPEKPVTIPTSGVLIPGFLGHNNRDDTVSVFYTCSLYKRMTDLGYTTEVMIGDEEGHGFPSGFLPAAWNFLSKRVLP